MAIYFDPNVRAPDPAPGVASRVQFDLSAGAPWMSDGATQFGDAQYAMGYNPELGYAPTPEGYLGRPERSMPDYFGLNTHANELAAAYNALQGYGPQMVDTNSESGGYEEDFGVVVDPWSGRVSRANNPYGTRNNYVSDALAKAMGSPDGSFYKGYDSYADFNPEARDAAFFQKQIEDSADDEGYYQGKFARLAAPQMSQQAEADYNANLTRFTEAKSGYEDAFGKVKEQFMSPVLDEQLRTIMPDDGKSFNNAFTTNYDHHVNTLNYVLKGRGVEDLREIGWTEHDGKTVFYNRRTGHGIKPDLFNYKGGKGDGNVTFKLKALDDGQVTFDTNFKKPSKWANGGWMDVLAPLALSFALGPVGKAVGGAVAGATASTIGAMASATLGTFAGGAVTGGISSAIFGGDPLKGALAAGTGSLVGNYVGGKYLKSTGASAITPALKMQAGLLGSVAGNAAGDLVMGKPIGDRYTTPAGQIGLARQIFAI